MLDPTLASVFNLIADVAAIVVLIGMSVFILLYSLLYNWRKRRAGKSVLFLALSLVIVALISYLAIWVSPDYWLRPLWRMGGWLFAAFSVGYLLYALLYNWQNRHPIEIPRKLSTTEIPIQEEK